MSRLLLAQLPKISALIAVLLLLPASLCAQRFSDWGTPSNLGPTVNTAFTDGCPSISRDGLSLFFASNRPGGFGGLDV